MILHAQLDTSGAIIAIQSAFFADSTEVDTATSAAYAAWYESLPANVTYTWPEPGA